MLYKLTLYIRRAFLAILSIFCEMSVRILCPFLNWVACLFICILIRMVRGLLFCIQSPFHVYVCKYFPPFCGFILTFFKEQKLNSDDLPFQFFLYGLFFLYLRNVQPKLQGCSFMFSSRSFIFLAIIFRSLIYFV